MVEMLGVLAIIGVLSVGAIAGYSKAMEKYKLNKQAEQLSHLLNLVYRHKASWGQKPPYMNLIEYFIKMGEIPEDMIKDNGTAYIYDSFGAKVSISTNGCSPTCNYINVAYHLGDDNFETCLNALNVAKEFHSQLWSVMTYKQANQEDTSYTGSGYWVGDKYCTSQAKCIRNMTLKDISTVCEYCAQSYYCSLNLQYEIID